MPKSTRRERTKPEKPYEGFPLFAHATRRWAKKIKGKLHYFGPWEDPMGALARYEAERDYLHTGRQPPPRDGQLSVEALADAFMLAKQTQQNNGELSPRSFAWYHKACKPLVKLLGHRPVTSLMPEDFAKLRTTLAENWGPTTLKVAILVIRGVFRFGQRNLFLDRPPRYGASFDVPSAAVLRRARGANGGPKLFTPDEFAKLRKAADVTLRAMLLTAANTGMGPTDLGRLPRSAVNLDTGWLEFARVKTGVSRRIPLWDETVKAIREAMAVRPRAARPEYADRLFLSKLGNPWVREIPKGISDSLGAGLRVLCDRLKIPCQGIYSFRRGLETHGGTDQPAIDAIMGHVARAGDMGSTYRIGVSDARLRAVASAVHGWLFGSDVKE